MELRALTNTIDCERPLYGMRARGLAPGETPHTQVEAIAADYIGHLHALQPRGPYALVGYSFGGLVAFEMACLLREAGEDVDFLGLIDTDVDDACLRPFERLAFRLMRPLRYAALIARNPAATIPDLWERFFRTRSIGAAAPSRTDDIMSPLLLRVAQLNRGAFSRYRPRPYPGPLTIFRATERWPRFCDPLPVWERLTAGPITICEIQGGHTELVQERGVAALARRLSALVEGTHGEESVAQPLLAQS
jgi:acetoacetyl-CoA synthetase